MPMSPRLATFLMFIVNGAVIGTWVAWIPTIKADLGASGTGFGVTLLFAPLGALVAQQINGQLLMRISSRQLLTISALILPWLMVLPMAAPGLPTLAAALFVTFYVVTSMDVAMNAHAVALEDARGASIMSGLHAGWSIGGVIGAVAVAAAIGLGVGRLPEALLAGALLWLVALAAARNLGTGSSKAEGASGFHLPSRAVWPIAGLIALIALVEGGLTDWGGIYLRGTAGASDEVAALAYGALSVGLTIGRLVGDAMKDRIGSIRMIQLGMLLAAVSITSFLVVGHPAFGLFGLLLAGIGMANALPQLIGASGRIRPYGPSLSAAFTSITLAFVIGPPIIGSTSDAIGMTWTLGILVVASVVVAVLVPRVPRAETNPRFATTAPRELSLER